jgi:hypothetical protein
MAVAGSRCVTCSVLDFNGVEYVRASRVDRNYAPLVFGVSEACVSRGCARFACARLFLYVMITLIMTPT